ncbi:endonuclease domain of the non-LTR retrotransposon LINE-1 [Elysia marginata]|uniref:Endonuclease domain of the non-LTR retrotransposon LINE-1 n=1 Tax=Elysia marginata TaxID=1093978 RepID=A0AAV4HLP3_9GAST|nr:endonuclease domain of the non-LTR retrotransposon LINE-1 [Elysia marginata]
MSAIPVRKITYSTAMLRFLQPNAPRLPAIDLSFVKARKRGRKGGIKVKHHRRGPRPFLPSVLMGNVRSLQNKTDELYSLTRYDQNFRHAQIITLTETWLHDNIPNSVCDLEDWTLFRSDRQHTVEKQRGGGVCTYINNAWCNPSNANVVKKLCDTNIEILCINLRPYYMPREFTGVFTVTVYIPPDANRDDAANSLKDTFEDLKNKSPDHLFIVTGDFNHCNDLNISDFHQFINVPTREDKTLDLFFCNVKSAYKCYSKPPLGSSDHQMILLFPKYRPVLRKIAPIKKTTNLE